MLFTSQLPDEMCVAGGWQERVRGSSTALQKGQGLSLVGSLVNTAWGKLLNKLLDCLRCVLVFAELCAKIYLI